MGNHVIQTPYGRFDSKAEYERYCALLLLQTAGAIEELKRQVPYPVTINGVLICRWYADYVYVDVKTKERIVEDCKGHKTDVYRLKKKLVEALHGIRILETPAGKMAANRVVW